MRSFLQIFGQSVERRAIVPGALVSAGTALVVGVALGSLVPERTAAAYAVNGLLFVGLIAGGAVAAAKASRKSPAVGNSDLGPRDGPGRGGASDPSLRFRRGGCTPGAPARDAAGGVAGDSGRRARRHRATASTFVAGPGGATPFTQALTGPMVLRCPLSFAALTGRCGPGYPW